MVYPKDSTFLLGTFPSHLRLPTWPGLKSGIHTCWPNCLSRCHRCKFDLHRIMIQKHHGAICQRSKLQKMATSNLKPGSEMKSDKTSKVTTYCPSGHYHFMYGSVVTPITAPQRRITHHNTWQHQLESRTNSDKIYQTWTSWQFLCTSNAVAVQEEKGKREAFDIVRFWVLCRLVFQWIPVRLPPSRLRNGTCVQVRHQILKRRSQCESLWRRSWNIKYPVESSSIGINIHKHRHRETCRIEIEQIRLD